MVEYTCVGVDMHFYWLGLFRSEVELHFHGATIFEAAPAQGTFVGHFVAVPQKDQMLRLGRAPCAPQCAVLAQLLLGLSPRLERLSRYRHGSLRWKNARNVVWRSADAGCAPSGSG